MRIQHNIMAMSAYRNYTNNVTAMQKNLEKLSSGYKINRAGDDAAGLAISEKMRAQITGLETAQKNAKDGISLVQTAEGALTEVHDMLNRMVELATQSANGTYDSETDRVQLQKEMNQLRSEIDRIADSANFNGINLLDGSMDSTYEAKVTTTSFDTILPDVAKVNGTDTVLHQDPATDTTGTTFSVDLHNTVFSNADTKTMTLKIGNEVTVTLTGDGSDALKGNALVSAIIDQITADNADSKAEVTIGGQTFKVEAGTAGSNRITFTQVAAPTGTTEEVNGSFAVSITGDVGSDTAVSAGGNTGGNNTTNTTPASVGGSAATGVYTNWQNASSGTGGTNGLTSITNADSGTAFDSSKITDYINDNQVALGSGVTTAQDVKIGKISASSQPEDGKLGLYVGNQLVGVAVDTDGNMVAFEATDGDGAEVTYQFAGIKDHAVVADTDLGTLTVKDNSSNAIAVGAFDTAVATGAQVTPGGDEDNLKTVDFKNADKDKILAAVPNTVSADTPITVKVTGTNIALYAGTEKISEDATFTAGDIDLKNDNGDTLLTIDAQSLTAIGDLGTNAIETGLTFTAATTTTNPGGNNPGGAGAGDTIVIGVADYNTETTAIKNVTADAGQRLASTTFNLSQLDIADGGKLQIGKDTYTFTTDEAQKDGTGKVYIGDLIDNSGNIDLSKAGDRLTEAAKANTTYTVGNVGGKMTFVERVGQSDYSGDNALTSFENIAKTFGYSVTEEGSSNGSALTLQIGPTAEKYNQLTVDIKDCHCAAMVDPESGLNIDEISIATQDQALQAIDVIKAAVNYVSDVRGTLGATQNRLDHTINNLSVMTENIQDAESTIRDVDVAEEMMAYTKNNILIQSAQAMLAQANQVPQGVLQLLQ